MGSSRGVTFDDALDDKAVALRPCRPHLQCHGIRRHLRSAFARLRGGSFAASPWFAGCCSSGSGGGGSGGIDRRHHAGLGQRLSQPRREGVEVPAVAQAAACLRRPGAEGRGGGCCGAAWGRSAGACLSRAAAEQCVRVPEGLDTAVEGAREGPPQEQQDHSEQRAQEDEGHREQCRPTARAYPQSSEWTVAFLVRDGGRGRGRLAVLAWWCPRRRQSWRWRGTSCPSCRPGSPASTSDSRRSAAGCPRRASASRQGRQAGKEGGRQGGSGEGRRGAGRRAPRGAHRVGLRTGGDKEGDEAHGGADDAHDHARGAADSHGPVRPRKGKHLGDASQDSNQQ